MRAHILICFLSGIISLGFASSAIAAGAPAGSASLAYQNRASNVVVQAVIPALAQRLDQLMAAGPTKIYYRIKADGGVESVRVVSARPNSFVRDTCTRVLKSTKFPPIPDVVRREQKKNYLDMSSEIGG
jgi:outer membrane biosynthesis protein TonB